MISAEIAERVKEDSTPTRDRLNIFAEKQPHLVASILKTVGNMEIAMAVASDMAIFQMAIEEQLKEA